MKFSKMAAFLWSALLTCMIHPKFTVFKLSPLVGIQHEWGCFGCFVMATVGLNGSLIWWDNETSRMTSNDVFQEIPICQWVQNVLQCVLRTKKVTVVLNKEIDKIKWREISKANLSFWYQSQSFLHDSGWWVTNLPELNYHQPSESGHPWEQWLVSQSFPGRKHSPGREFTIMPPCM